MRGEESDDMMVIKLNPAIAASIRQWEVDVVRQWRRDRVLICAVCGEELQERPYVGMCYVRGVRRYGANTVFAEPCTGCVGTPAGG